MYKIINSSILAGEFQTVMTSIPGRLIAIAFTATTGCQLGLKANFGGVLSECVIIGPLYNININADQSVITFGNNLPYGRLNYRITISNAQTTERAASFIYEENP